MDHRNVKCNDFLWRLGMWSSLAGIVQTAMASFALAARLLRNCRAAQDDEEARRRFFRG